MKHILLFLSFVSFAPFIYGEGFIDVSPNRTDDTVDDTSYLRGLINSAPENSLIRIPAGRLTLNGVVKLANSSGKPVSISGVHSNLTTVFFKTGGFHLPAGTRKIGGSNVSGISMLIDQVSSRAAIYNEGGSLIEDVIIRGTNANKFWKKSVEVFGDGATIINCHFTGKKDGNRGTLYHVEHHGPSGGGSRITIENSTLDGAKMGVYIHDTKAEGHGFGNVIVRNVDIAGTKSSGQPSFKWTACWLKASNRGLQIDGLRDSRVRANVINVSGNGAGHAAITYSHKTQQNSVVRSNLITAKSAMKVLETRPNGGFSGKVNDISLFANYIKGSEVAYDLRGRGFKLFFMGNVLANVNNEFDTRTGIIDRVFATELEVQ